MGSVLRFCLLAYFGVLTLAQDAACGADGNRCLTQFSHAGVCAGGICVPDNQINSFVVGDLTIAASELWEPANQGWGNPLQTPRLPPLNQRVLRWFWTADGVTALPNQAGLQTLDLNLRAVPTAGSTFQVRLEAPWLELPTDANPNARCNPPAALVKDAYLDAASKLMTCTQVGATSVVRCTPNAIHLMNYFTHAPYPGQNPFMRTYRKICIRAVDPDPAALPVGPSAANPWIDTNLWFATEHPCNDAHNPPTTPTLNFRCDLSDTTGMAIAFPTTAPAAPQDSLGIFRISATNVPIVAQAQPAPITDHGETPEMRRDRLGRTRCCGSSAADTSVTPNLVAQYGVCINTKLQSCCGWRPYSPDYEKCCSKRTARISWHTARCPCQTSPLAAINTEEIRDCQNEGANSFNTVANNRGRLDTTNTRNRCCTSLAYPELLSTRIGNDAAATPVVRTGTCFNLDADRCCSTDGGVYDVGSQQCCSINGVQSINVPCPCNIDSQCGTGKRCCVQSFPPPVPQNQYPNVDATNPGNQCNVYANFPSGSGLAAAQRCFGQCYSTAFQICCNGQVCVREYDKCCNSTCCNRHTSSCMDGFEQGTTNPAGAKINALNLRVPFEKCSEVENLTARRTLFVFVFPTMFLLATLISLAMVTILARRATEHHFDLVEQALVFCSVCITLLACGFYFSPVYKYGVVITFMGLFAIVTAVIRRLAWSVTLVFVILVLILFLVDPFAGNIYLSFSSGIPPTGDSSNKAGSPLSHSLFEALARLIAFRNECTGFYDWFRFDGTVRDTARVHNPMKMEFGYCTRAWLSTLVIFLIFIVLLTLVSLSLAIMSVVKKLAPPQGDDVIQLEVKRGSDVYTD